MAPRDDERSARRYVYAVVPAEVPALPEMTGLDGRAVSRIREGSLSALVSEVTADRVRPTRANLSAHQQVVSEVHRLVPVLPVRFGTVFPDEDTVKAELLAPEQPELEAKLSEFDGKDEFRVKCRYLPDVALREVVERNVGIRKLRSRVKSAASPAARQAHQIRLGEMVMLELERLRDRDATALIGALAPHILAWEPVDDPSDDVPLHAALLVDRTRVPDLDAALEKVASQQKDRMQVELIGPLPLWDFTNVSAGAA